MYTPPEYRATLLVSDFERVQAVEECDRECSSAQEPFHTYCQKVQQMGYAEKRFHSGFQVPDRETRLNKKNRDWECVVGNSSITRRLTPPDRFESEDDR
jgi:hypothetical protein